MVQAIEQGECTACSRSDDNYSVEKRLLGDEGINYLLSCECGTAASVSITEDGLDRVANVSHESASWNES